MNKIFDPTDLSATITRMMSVQTRLNRLAGMPYLDDPEHPTLAPYERVITALMVEAAEALQNMKKYWAWWRQSAALHEELLQEEIIDVMFFTLSVQDLLHTLGRIEFEGSDEEFAQLVTGSIQEISSGLEEVTGDPSYDKYLEVRDLENLTDDDLRDIHDVLVSLVKISLNMSETLSEDGEDGTRAFILLSYASIITLARSVGLDNTGLWEAYREKALVNLSRWQNAGLFTDTDTTYVETLSLLNDKSFDALPTVSLSAREQKLLAKRTGNTAAVSTSSDFAPTSTIDSTIDGVFQKVKGPQA